uniref:HSF-type DNA-binding domain-containing protein n=1 Tax=Tetraodon nigroviridis TaxID=99883 RepID=H3DQC8_TETNG
HSMASNLFPTKLWQLADDSTVDAITWNHQGDGIIVNKNLIEKQFLSLNGFKASSSSSFVRQLNLYGFKKSQCFNRGEPNIHHYFHPNFKRNQPELITKYSFGPDMPQSWTHLFFVPENPHMSPPTFIVPSLWQHQGSPADPECMEVDDSDQIGCPMAPDQKPYDPRSGPRINNDPKIHLGKRRIAYKPYGGTRDKRLYHEHKLQTDVNPNAYIFASKLWQLVSNSDIDAIIWNHQGDGIIVNQKLIGEEFFSLNGFNAFSPSSFVRQLNLHGFKRLARYKREPNIHHYFHRNFKRNRPELLPLVRRCSPRSKSGVSNILLQAEGRTVR